MFDDIVKKSDVVVPVTEASAPPPPPIPPSEPVSLPVASAPQKVVDMFEGVPEPAAEAKEMSSTNTPSLSPAWRGSGPKKLLLILGIFLILVLIVASAVLFLRSRRSQDTSVLPETVETKDAEPVAKESVESAASIAPDIEVRADVLPPEPPLDTDGDGLTDEQEKAFGTDSKLSDTDLDGLSDKAEIRDYGTNPLAKDTDADGYDDGMEVKNGFNPKGTGKAEAAP